MYSWNWLARRNFIIYQRSLIITLQKWIMTLLLALYSSKKRIISTRYQNDLNLNLINFASSINDKVRSATCRSLIKFVSTQKTDMCINTWRHIQFLVKATFHISFFCQHVATCENRAYKSYSNKCQNTWNIILWCVIAVECL